MSARPSRRRVVGFALVWLVVSVVALSAPGCYGRNCDGGTETFGANAGEGEMKDENSWQSAGPTDAWLFFPGQRSYIFEMRGLGGRTPDIVTPYLSAALEPSKGGNNFTVGAGNLALLSNPAPNRIDIRNDSCSDFYLRMVVQVAPFPPTVTTDAGNADGGTTTNDAGDAGP